MGRAMSGVQEPPLGAQRSGSKGAESSSPIGKEACADVIIAYAQKLQK